MATVETSIVFMPVLIMLLHAGTPEDTLTHLEQILGKLTAFHVSKTEKDPGHPLDNFFPDATEVCVVSQQDSCICRICAYNV